MGEFDDILGQDDPEKEHKKWIEENKTEEPTNKSFKTLNDTYQKSQRRWKLEAEVKEELKKRFDEAEKELIKEKLEFEQEYTVDFDDEILKETDLIMEFRKAIWRV